MFVFCGFQQVKVLADSTGADLDLRSPYKLVEFTNKTADPINVTINDFSGSNGGKVNDTIPIPANSTRQVPMAVFCFKASAAVDVVAYK